MHLILVGCAGEEGSARVHLGHDASGGPNIDARVVGPAAKQNIGRTVPQGDDFVGKGINRDAKGTGKTEVGQLQLAAVVDEQVLGLEIAVEDAGLVAESNALEQLVHEGLDGGWVEGTAVTARVHVALEVLVHELKDEHELVLGVDDIVQQDNVLVAQLLHERNLADGRRGRALLRVEVDLLEGDEFARLAVAALEYLGRGSAWAGERAACVRRHYRGIGALAELLELLEGAGVAAVVHGGHQRHAVAVAEVADADG